MEKRFLVIKNKETRQAVKKFAFNLCDYEHVNEMKNVYMLDFCEFNDLDYRKYFAEKYPELKGKSIKDMVLEIVTNIANNWKSNEGLEIVCGWETETKPRKECGEWFDFMAGECYHEEINKVMKEQGFRIYEDFGGFRHRARTTYRLEY